jgi:hypothetical protein
VGVCRLGAGGEVQIDWMESPEIENKTCITNKFEYDEEKKKENMRIYI